MIDRLDNPRITLGVGVHKCCSACIRRKKLSCSSGEELGKEDVEERRREAEEKGGG